MGSNPGVLRFERGGGSRRRRSRIARCAADRRHPRCHSRRYVPLVLATVLAVSRALLCSPALAGGDARLGIARPPNHGRRAQGWDEPAQHVLRTHRCVRPFVRHAAAARLGALHVAGSAHSNFPDLLRWDVSPIKTLEQPPSGCGAPRTPSASSMARTATQSVSMQVWLVLTPSSANARLRRGLHV